MAATHDNAQQTVPRIRRRSGCILVINCDPCRDAAGGCGRIQPLISWPTTEPGCQPENSRLWVSFAFRIGLPVHCHWSTTPDTPGFSQWAERRRLLLSADPRCPMFPIVGIVRVGASYYQSIGQPGYSSLLTYSDPMLILPLFLWLLPMFWGLDGVWLAMTFANAVLSAILITVWAFASKWGSILLPVQKNI